MRDFSYIFDTHAGSDAGSATQSFPCCSQVARGKICKGHGSPGQVLCDNEAAVRDSMARHEFARALEMLIQYYQDAILRYCRCHILDTEIAREVAQEIFLAALKALPRFRGQASLKTWLYGIAIKKCLEAGRNGDRRESLARDNWRLIVEGVHCEPHPPPDEAWQQAKQRQMVWQALHQLRVQDRELVMLHYLEDLTYDEMAHILRVSKRTVERRLRQAQARFHQAYERCQTQAMVSRPPCPSHPSP